MGVQEEVEPAPGPAPGPAPHAGDWAAGAADEEVPERSLLDDVEALIDDGRTYLEAEIAYQKSRAAYAADGAKSALILGAVALLLGFLALIGLTVGAIIALSPYLTAWGASALVVVLLALGALLAARGAARHWRGLMGLVENRKDGEA